MLNYFVDLKNVPKINCNLSLLKSRVNIDPDQYVHKVLHNENHIWLSKEFEEWLSKFGMLVRRCDIFHTNPNRYLRWHIDVFPPRDYVKINWVYEKGISHIIWGKLIGEQPTKPTITPFGRQHLGFDDDVIQPVVKHILVGPTLFNAGVPHRVDNRKDTNRWCLSAVLNYKDSQKNVLWKDAVELFRDYSV